MPEKQSTGGVQNKNESEAQSKQDRQKKKKKISWQTIVIIILAILLLLLLLRSCGNTPAPIDNPSPSGIVWDKDATTKDIDKMSKEELEALLNEKVKQTELNMSLNTAPEFENGSSTGILNIYNDEINNYPQKVTITLDSDDSIIYESDAIPIGSRIIESKLDVKLGKGEYQCTAHFYALNPETGEALGEGRVPIKVTIKN